MHSKTKKKVSRKQKVIDAARRLADKIEEPGHLTYSTLGVGMAFEDGKPSCALGHVIGKAGLKRKGDVELSTDALGSLFKVSPTYLNPPIIDAALEVERANDTSAPPTALAKALRDFATVLSTNPVVPGR